MSHEISRNDFNVISLRNHLAKPNIETRFVALQDIELRAEPDQDLTKPFRFSGYAVKWNSINSHREQFVKGAFTDFINAVKAGSQKCHMYYNHGWNFVWVDPTFGMRVGKWLEFEEDDIGFKVYGEITPRLRLAEDVRAMLEHETVDGLSVAFYKPNEMDIEYLDDYVRIKRVGLYEISVCDEPSDRDARLDNADIRKIETEEDLKAFLKRFNLDNEASNQLIQRVKSFGQQPDDSKAELKKNPLDWISI